MLQSTQITLKEMAKLKISLRYSKQLTEDYSEEEALALGNFL